MLSTQEKELVLYKWNKTTQSFPSEKCIHHLVEEQVKCTPDAAAIQLADGSSISYENLVRRCFPDIAQENSIFETYVKPFPFSKERAS